MDGYAVDPWRSFRRTVGVVLFGWAAAAVTARASYLALRWVWVPIAVGFLLCLAFAVFLMLLHRAGWIALLSFVPGLFVLVGAVQYAPEAALEVRGVRESVVIGGLVAWTLMAVLAGRRGHVRRRRGKTDSLLLSL
ncbi:hypothetical protein ACH5AO_19990 [Streptomyces sp. NPDC018964]|uniref:hypothetical protein n=1 Tax=unclassified Streptomyces TaxID=2593676 RepID=UPI0037A8FEFB